MRILLCILVFISCSPTSKPKAITTTNAPASNSTLYSQGVNTNLSTSQSGTLGNVSTQSQAPTTNPVQPIDATKLKIYNLSVGKLLQGGTRQEVINYSISGQASYVWWQLCPEESTNQAATCSAINGQTCGLGGACVQNVTPFNKIIFPHLYAGNVLLTLKACIESDYALDPNQTCGAPTSIVYNSHVTNTQVTSLFAQRQSLIDQLNAIGQQKKQLYSNYKGDLSFCLAYDKKNAAYYKAKIDFMDNVINQVFFDMWLWAPKEIIKEVMKSALGQNLISPVVNGIENGLSKIKNGICNIGESTGEDTQCLTTLKNSGTTMTVAQQNAFCKNSAPTPGMIGTICSAIGTFLHAMASMVEYMNPALGAGMISDAFRTIIDPNGSQSMQCQAEQKLAKASQAIDSQVAVLGQQLIEVDNQLSALGEL